MLYLQTRIQLQEVKTSVFGEEILHGAGAHVANHFGETYGVLRHTNWNKKKINNLSGSDAKLFCLQNSFITM